MSKIETESCSKFVKNGGCVTTSDGVKKCYYHCNRSGAFSESIERNKRLKHAGSVKVWKAYPASITVCKVEHDGLYEISVRYQRVHLGHEIKIGKKSLDKDERQFLAAQMNLGIPKAKIQDIAASFSPTKRISYSTNKDLNNIKRDFKLDDEEILHPDDVTSIHMHVDKLDKLLQDEPNCRLVYKPIGETTVYPDIDSTDVLLGYMNQAQKTLLELYGKNGIMIDSTHGTNQYGFQLTSILINDSNCEGFPVPFLFSSKTKRHSFHFLME